MTSGSFLAADPGYGIHRNPGPAKRVILEFGCAHPPEGAPVSTTEYVPEVSGFSNGLGESELTVTARR